MRGPVQNAVITDLLAYTSARVYVCLVQRVCPSNRANFPFLPFSLLLLAVAINYLLGLPFGINSKAKICQKCTSRAPLSMKTRGAGALARAIRCEKSG